MVSQPTNSFGSILLMVMLSIVGSYCQWSSDSMAMAIAATQSGTGLNQAARSFGVPKATLKRHIDASNVYAKNGKKFMGRPTTLPPEVEEQLVTYLLEMDRSLFGVSRKDLMALAFQVADRNKLAHRFNKEAKMAGKDWFNGFMNRHPNISLRKPESTSLARASGFNREAVWEFFNYLENLLDRYCLDGTRVYNMDETSLSTVQRPQKVIGQKGKSQVGSLSSGERGTNTTGVFCVSASGHWLPPMLIYKRKRLSNDLACGAPPGTLFKCTPKGWIDKDTFVDWLRHFVSHVNCTPQNPVILILDGHSSHTKNIEAVDLARASGVAMLSLPPHTKHRLQPLDVAFSVH